jgi:hypothetical protein
VYLNAKMTTVEATSGMGKGMIKDNYRWGELMYDIFDIL